jgi:hypothetical protein
MSKVGLWLCSIYAVVIALCLAMSFSSDGDTKGQFVFMQLPIALQGGLLVSVGLGDLLMKLTWPTAYIVLATPTFLFLYFIGWLFTRNPSRIEYKR